MSAGKSVLLTILAFLLSADLGAIQIPFGFFKQQSNKLNFITSAQSIYIGNCSGITTVQSQLPNGTAKNMTVDTTVNLTSVSGVTYYSDSTCMTTISSVTILSGTSSANFYYIVTTSGSKNLEATATGLLTSTQTTTVSANPFIWTGGGGNTNWNNGLNWSGGSAPSNSSHQALFSSSCASNCSVDVNLPISISGIRMESGYTGTITQGASSTITLANNWIQMGGNFTGVSATMVIGGSFLLSSGSYKATSGTTTYKKDFIISGSSNFTHNFGTSSFIGNFNNNVVATPNGNALYHVSFGGDLNNVTLNGTMSVDGDLTLADVNNGAINSGTIEVKGNLTATSMGKKGTTTIRLVGSLGQTVTGVTTAFIPSLEIAPTAGIITLSGTLRLQKHFTVTGTPTIVSTGSTLQFANTSSSEAQTITGGSAEFNNVYLGGNNSSFTINGNLNVGGDLTLADTNAGRGALNSGTIVLKGNLTSSNYGKIGTALIQIAGTGAASQTITGGSSTSLFPSIEIKKTGTGNVIFAGDISINKNYTYTSGTIDAGASNLYFYLYAGTQTSSITAGSGPVYNNVIFSANGATYALTDTMTIGGTLTLYNPNATTTANINGGQLNATGNVVISGTNSGFNGTTTLNLSGTNSTTLSTVSSGRNLQGAISVNKTGATVTLGSNFVMTSGQDLTISSGTLDLAGYNLTNGRNISNSGTLKRGNSPSCGTLSYTGSYTGTAAICP